MTREWIDYLFTNEDEEPFFVEVLLTDGFEVAQKIAKNAFGENIKFLDVCTPEEAEVLGYDTY